MAICWRAPATIDWLSCFARRREPSRVLIVATYRPGEAGAEQAAEGVAAVAHHAQAHPQHRQVHADDQHRPGDTLDGRVVNVTDFGLFIDIYNGLEGLAHVSEIELAAGTRPEDIFHVGDWVRCRILRIEEDEKKVGLSMRGVAQPSEEEVAELEAAANAKRSGQ